MPPRLLGDLNSLIRQDSVICFSFLFTIFFHLLFYFPLTSSFVKIYISSPSPQMKLKDSLLQSFLLTRFDYESKTVSTNIHFLCVFTPAHIDHSKMQLVICKTFFCFLHSRRYISKTKRNLSRIYGIIKQKTSHHKQASMYKIFPLRSTNINVNIVSNSSSEAKGTSI